MNKDTSKTIVPRSFVLIDELEKSEKGQYSPYCTIGIKDMTDMELKYWNGIIMTFPESAIKEQVITFEIFCDLKYPDMPPKFKMINSQSFLNIKKDDKVISHTFKQFLSQDGTINDNLPILKKWTRDKRLINVMDQIKKILESNVLPNG